MISAQIKISIKIPAMLLALAMLFCLAACKPKEPVTVDDFNSAAADAGLSFPEDAQESGDIFILKYSYAENEKIKISFSEFESEENASELFDVFDEMNEEEKGNVVTSQTTINVGGSYQRHSFKSNGVYYCLVRVENTVINCRAEASEKKKVDELIKEIGY